MRMLRWTVQVLTGALLTLTIAAAAYVGFVSRRWTRAARW